MLLLVQAPPVRIAPAGLAHRHDCPRKGDFLALLKADEEVTKALPEAQIEACFDLGYHTKAVDEIFGRIIPDDQ